jgi:antitoxin HigA-1
MRTVAYPHPGEVLVKEFLEPMGITQYRLSKEIGLDQSRIGQIASGRRSMSPDTALRLAKFFGTSDAFWITLQAHYDAAKARGELAEVLKGIKTWPEVAASEQPAP